MGDKEFWVGTLEYHNSYIGVFFKFLTGVIQVANKLSV
jgi:hypothetical protein